MLKLTLVTPVKKLATDLPVEEVIMPGHRGELDVLPGHSPLITTLATGILKYKEAGQTEYKEAAISWGYCEVFGEKISVLAETAEFPDEIDADRARAAMKKAEENLTAFNAETYDFEKYRLKLERANVRLSIAKKEQ